MDTENTLFFFGGVVCWLKPIEKKKWWEDQCIKTHCHMIFMRNFRGIRYKNQLYPRDPITF